MALRVWPRFGPPLVQSMNLVHAVALAVSPMMMSSFLGDYRNMTSHATNVSVLDSDIASTNVTSNDDAFFMPASGNADVILVKHTGGEPNEQFIRRTRAEDDGMPIVQNRTNSDALPFLKIELGFLIIGAISVFGGLMCISVYIHEYFKSRQQSMLEGVRPDVSGYESLSQFVTSQRRPRSIYAWRHKCNTNLATLVVVMSIAAFCTVSGVKFVLLVNYLYTFLNQTLNWSPSSASALIAAFQFARFGFGLAIVPASQLLRPRTLLIADVIVVAVTSLALTFTINSGHLVMWICIMPLALGSCSVAGTLSTLAAESVPFGSGALVGITYGSVGLAQIIFPPVVATLLNTYGAVAFPAMLLASSLVGVIPLTSWLVFADKVKKNNRMFVMDEEEVIFEVSENDPLLACCKRT